MFNVERTTRCLRLRPACRAALGAVVLLGGLSFTADDEAPKLALKPRELWSSVFAETVVKPAYLVQGPAGAEVVTRWRLSVAEHTLERGEIAQKLDANGSALATLELRVPKVNPGVTLFALLDVELQAAKGDAPVAAGRRKIWIFHRDAFADRQKWLEKLKIAVYDPADTTVETLEKAELPLKRLRRLPAADDRPGILIVGEAVAIEEQRDIGGEARGAGCRRLQGDSARTSPVRPAEMPATKSAACRCCGRRGTRSGRDGSIRTRPTSRKGWSPTTSSTGPG